MHHSTSFSKRKEGCHAATLQSYSIIVPKASLPNRYYITLKIDCQYKIITKTKKRWVVVTSPTTHPLFRTKKQSKCKNLFYFTIILYHIIYTLST